jgi:hypothetical protein
MTYAESFNSIFAIIQMMVAIGVPLCMVAGWVEPAKKNRTTRRRKTKRREADTNKKVKVTRKPPKAKGYKPRPLSNSEQGIFDAYHFGRSFPGVNQFSNIPL